MLRNTELRTRALIVTLTASQHDLTVRLCVLLGFATPKWGTRLVFLLLIGRSSGM